MAKYKVSSGECLGGNVGDLIECEVVVYLGGVALLLFPEDEDTCASLSFGVLDKDGFYTRVETVDDAFVVLPDNYVFTENDHISVLVISKR